MFIKMLVDSFLCGVVKLNMIVPWIEIKPKSVALYNPRGSEKQNFDLYLKTNPKLVLIVNPICADEIRKYFEPEYLSQKPP